MDSRIVLRKKEIADLGSRLAAMPDKKPRMGRFRELIENITTTCMRVTNGVRRKEGKVDVPPELVFNFYGNGTGVVAIKKSALGR